MTLHDLSHARRIATLSDRVADLERQIESLSQVTAAPAAPRDIWLGRTTANGQTYPTSGNTFFVELIRGDFDLAAGDQAVTEYPRSTIVCARTWPAAYVPEDQQVVVMRMRGKQGPGEWWIESHSVDLSTLWAELIGGYSYDDAPGSVIGGPSSSWGQELTGIVDGRSTAADEVGSGRIKLTTGGLYHVTAHADCALRYYATSGGGYSPQRDNLTLAVLLDGREVASSFARIESDSAGGRVTIHLSARIDVSAEDDPLQLWISGAGGSWGAGHLSVWRWRLFAVRIGD